MPLLWYSSWTGASEWHESARDFLRRVRRPIGFDCQSHASDASSDAAESSSLCALSPAVAKAHASDNPRIWGCSSRDSVTAIDVRNCRTLTLTRLGPSDRIRIESKESARQRGVHSPDRADALMLALGHHRPEITMKDLRIIPRNADREAESSADGGFITWKLDDPDEPSGRYERRDRKGSEKVVTRWATPHL